MTNIVKYSILPEDFRFQVTLDEKGRARTNELGLSRFNDHSVRYSATWYNTLVGEMIQAFVNQFNVNVDDIDVLSRYDIDGSLVCWLRTHNPLPPIGLPGPDAKKPLPSTDEPLTVEAEIVADKPKALTSRRTSTPDHVIDLDQ